MTWRISAVLGSALTVLAASSFAQPDFTFMPDGGRQTLARLLDEGKIRLEEILHKQDGEEGWRALLAAADSSLDEAASETLAAYLAVNMPVEADAATVEQLPPDGKELAIDNCQFCHSFFTGYLVHDRDTEGWRAIFKSPFHMELPMNPAERETFARYSAINMPIDYDDVPEELRF